MSTPPSIKLHLVFSSNSDRAFGRPAPDKGVRNETNLLSAARTHPDYLTKGARLYRRRGQDITLIRDFMDMDFSAIRDPYDWRNPGNSGHTSCHPLDGDER